MTTLARYRDDASPPALRAAIRDLAVRGVLPAVALLATGLLVGWLVVPPLSALTGEDQLNVSFQSGRTATLDYVARLASTIGGVSGNAVICVLATLLLWAMSRQWWLATLPVIALNLHIFVHIVTSTLVARPRPNVEHLDIGQPTASFPSGHMGATTAQLLVVVLFLWFRVENLAVRIVIITITGVYLFVLAWSRIYLGMHHPTDVIWGAINGITCGLIAWLYLRRTSTQHPLKAE
ncbi:MAG TPA: phosphatase PAP2 family protein [Propionicimonas sp.]|jgi:undecaprenyl-diphosphatase